METSVFIAKIFSVVYVTFGLGLLINSNDYKVVLNKLLENTSFLLFGGFLGVVAGVSIINFHNHWVINWTVIVTLIGWIALVKGIYLLIYPKSFVVFKVLLSSKSYLKLMAFISIVFGGILGYFAFL